MVDSNDFIKSRDDVLSHIDETVKNQKRLLIDILKDYKTLVMHMKKDMNKKTSKGESSTTEPSPIVEFLTTNTTNKMDLLKKDLQIQAALTKEKVKVMTKEIKLLSNTKKSNKSQITSPVRKMNNGLTKEFNISSELCQFLNTEENSKKCRSEVTKYIHGYIREKGLKAESGNFRVDENLSKLFDVDKDEKVAFFSLGKLLNTHFSYPEPDTSSKVNEVELSK